MPAYVGKDLVVQWATTGGTTTVTGDFRSFSYTPSVDLVDQTAGPDTQKTYLPNLKDGQCSLAAVMQASGTALSVALAEGTQGTLFVGPEGTASTKQKLTIPAISMGAKFNIPYADIVELSCDFQQNGARTDGAW